jgi:hypothetical protein
MSKGRRRGRRRERAQFMKWRVGYMTGERTE